MKRFLVIIFSFFLILPSLATAQIPTHIVKDEDRIPITNFVENDYIDVDTNGVNIIWRDNTDRSLIIYSILQNEFGVLQEDNPRDLVYGGISTFAYLKGERPTSFQFFKDGQDVVVELGHEISSLHCSNGNKLAYLSFEGDLYLYDLNTGTDELISQTVNGNYFFCSVTNDFLSYNEPNQIVLRHIGSHSNQYVIPTTEGGARSTLLLDRTLYYDQAGNLHSYDINTGETVSHFPVLQQLRGYVDQFGIHYISYISNTENGIQHVYVYLPQGPIIYRVGSIDFMQSIHDFNNGIVTWIELNNQRNAILGVNFKNLDTDKDGLVDLEEIIFYETNPENPDSDGDGFNDLAEIENGYFPNIPSQPADIELMARLSGRILLQVETLGEAWYVFPANQLRYYLANGEAAYQIMRQLGLGITNENLAKIPVAGSGGTGDAALIEHVKGQILLQVESRGEAWYVDPVKGERHYLKDGQAAYDLMRNLGLGITNADLNRMTVGKL